MCEEWLVAAAPESFSSVAGRSPSRWAGVCLWSVLRRAGLERRLSVGLAAAARHLAGPGGALLCVSAAPRADCAAHMLDVLLRAFCHERGIPVLRVDSERKLRRLLGLPAPAALECVLLHAPAPARPPSEAERALCRLCETPAGPPVVRLPDT